MCRDDEGSEGDEVFDEPHRGLLQPQASMMAKSLSVSGSDNSDKRGATPKPFRIGRVATNYGERWSRKVGSGFLLDRPRSKDESASSDSSLFNPLAQSTGKIPIDVIPKSRSHGVYLQTCNEESVLKYDDFHPSCSSTTKIPPQLLPGSTVHSLARANQCGTVQSISEGSSMPLIVPEEVLDDIHSNVCHHFTVYHESLPIVRVRSKFSTGSRSYNIMNKVAEGAYGQIYKAKDDAGEISIIKVVDRKLKPFEAHVMDVIKDHGEYFDGDWSSRFGAYFWVTIYSGGGYVINMPYYPHGTMLQLVNRVMESGEGEIHEKVLAYWAHQLLEATGHLHRIGLIHMDIKPDNVMMRHTAPHQPPRLIIIDFGSAIHLNALHNFYLSDAGSLAQPAASSTSIGACERYLFNYQYKLVEDRCPRMREGQPWRHEQDYFGVISTLHVPMFTSYIKVLAPTSVTSTQPVYTITKVPKRKWLGQEQWRALIHDMLNPLASTIDLAQYSKTFELLHDVIPNSNDYSRNLALIHKLLINVP